MAIIVIALGVVMVLGGAYEIYFGNTYISVERGWSAFISGTVLFTGGLVTIALGLAIRAVTDLTTALTRQPPMLPAGPSQLATHVEPAFNEPSFAMPTPTTDAVAPRSVPSSAALADTLAPEPTLDPPSFDVAAGHLQAAAGPLQEPAEPHRDFDAPMAPDLAAEGERFEPVRAMPEERGAPPSLRPAVAARTVPEEEPSAMDDWLDRSFADLGREFGSVVDPTSRHVGEQDAAGAEAVIDHAAHAEEPHEQHEHEHHEIDEPAPAAIHEPVEAPHAEVAHSDPEEPAPLAPATSAVIGRYEAEGTSYVMYADGSIEAQSDAGVYRFASMAELKSFIEG